MEAPYGSWPSPISGEVVARDPGWPYSGLVADHGALYWIEARSHEDGRDVVVADGVDAIPAGASARTRVHEYGGGAYTVHAGTVYFCDDADQRVYATRDGVPVPLTPAPPHKHGVRYADLQVTPDGRTLICVRERDGDPEHINDLVAFPTDGSAPPVVLAEGHDFYSSPRISPDGSRLAWLVWDHPRMPWEGTELHVAELKEGLSLFKKRLVAGGADEAIVQPAWSPDGVLHYSSDRTGWWNLYRESGTVVTALEAEVGGPLWVFGESYYDFLDDGRIVLTYFSAGADHLAVVERDGTLRDIALDCTRIVDLTADGRRALFVGASPTRSLRVYALDVDDGGLETLSPDADELVPEPYVSVPRALEFPTTGGKTAHAIFYPPHHPEYEGPPDERPPLVVRIHGGPTAHVSSILRPEIQFFTSRGIAVVDVNYGGSTGYGREYRDRLRGTWGIVDTDDAVNCARHLAQSGEVDGARMTITGGSAGGWTVLCALTQYPDVFACGADYYGVAELTAFVDDTHKFESRYFDYLIGPFDEAAWTERSPLTHADKIRVPVIVLQGDEDKVVPPAQSEVIVAALERNGIDHEYIVFSGEQHGFRKADSLRRAAEAELAFYGRVLGFDVHR
ncbi:prolyl oligopeptidase family serine peptidase [Solirubrobacter phytolaccae]|uniref:Prolyl oligopeptidase family serine peptidase n=1 Tax=Solirubrobacter phytolaccae TaxID=1404360 RepID=A0A9X3N940_9ACTN|nr:prolyl oligopeptidase family serine peptidase [Solirubrobacter phytolaccae]MDA0180699.1 prolyl oligopeptidase family serine peptidase [Solirubrobacter phytolaccae]